MKTLSLLPRAEVDMIEAALWYEGERVGLGQAFEKEFHRLAIRIQESPAQFPEVESGIRRGLLAQFPYGVFFIVEDDAVVVIAVLHLHRDPETLRARR